MLIGAVADDLTGATDLALTLAREGLATVQVIGVPDDPAALAGAEAVVVALKSRTIPAGEAVAMSLESARMLQAAGVRQLFFKYCSTFDSTDAGNIGPVAAAMLDLAGGDLTIACPAFPANGRRVYRGHLFVGDVLLSDSPMRDHPLTPMRDANLVRVLSRQTDLKVGLVPLEVVEAGPAAIAAAFAAARAKGERILIVDAASDADLRAIGRASAGLPLVTGGSGVALGLPANFRAAGTAAPARPQTLAAPPGRAVILAGSCSAATRGQVAAAIAAGVPALKLDVAEIAAGRQTAAAVADWVAGAVSADRAGATGDRPPLVYSSAEPDAVARIQAEFGVAASGALVEDLLAAVARDLLGRGFSRFLVAGGETSGAVVAALGVTALEIGPEIDPGVPWTRARGGPDVALALKSGNFGAPDFFLEAWSLFA